MNIPQINLSIQILILFIGTGCAVAPQYWQEDLPKEKITGFESGANAKGIPNRWVNWHPIPSYSIELDSTKSASGDCSAVIRGLDEERSGFGSMALEFAGQYAADSIELRVKMKMHLGKKSKAGIILRLNDEYSAIGMETLEIDHSFEGHDEWQAYTLSMPYKESAQKIWIAGILKGSGQVWYDDFEVFVDGTKIHQISPRDVTRFLAPIDREFDKGSGINIDSLSADGLHRLTLTIKVWAFLKYHHPYVAKGKLNWDYELFRAIRKSQCTADKQAYSKSISEWMKCLRGTQLKSNDNTASGVTTMVSDTSWIDTTNFTKSLVRKLRSTLVGGRPPKHYYVSMNSLRIPSFTNEMAYASISQLDVGYRLLSLARLWAAINYFYPYKSLLATNWDETLTRFIPIFIEAEDNAAYEKAVLALLVCIQDNHSADILLHPKYEKYFGRRYVLPKFRYIEGSPVVHDFYSTSAPVQSGFHSGDALMEVDGRPVSQIFDSMQVFIPASNDATKQREFCRLLSRGHGDTILYKVKRAEEVIEIREPTIPANLLEIKDWIAPTYQLIEHEIGLIHGMYFNPMDVIQMTKSFEKVQGLIIDMRGYPKHFFAPDIMKWLSGSNEVFAALATTTLRQPGVFQITNRPTTNDYIFTDLKDLSSRYQGELILLVNEHTQSQAEFLTMLLMTYPNTTMIGSTTAGTDGDITKLMLPGKIPVTFSSVGVYFPDGRVAQQDGITPQLNAVPTIAGIREGRDEVLEKAIAILSTKK